MRTEIGRIRRTRTEHLDRVTTGRARQRREEAFRWLRMLCQDADELLAQAAEAPRVGDAGAALEPLARVRDVASSIPLGLRRAAPVGLGSVGRQGALDEDRVMATLALVEELDSQLRDARIGYRGAGYRAGQLAARLVIAVDELGRAAACGRTRSRASGVADDAA